MSPPPPPSPFLCNQSRLSVGWKTSRCSPCVITHTCARTHTPTEARGVHTLAKDVRATPYFHSASFKREREAVLGLTSTRTAAIRHRAPFGKGSRGMRGFFQKCHINSGVKSLERESERERETEKKKEDELCAILQAELLWAAAKIKNGTRLP